MKPKMLGQPGFLHSGLGRYGIGVTAGLFAMSHAQQGLSALRTGDITRAGLNIGLATGGGYVAYQLWTGNAQDLGKQITRANTHLIQGLRNSGLKRDDAVIKGLQSMGAFIRNISTKVI